MSPSLILACVSVMFVFGAVATYSPETRALWWFPAITAGLAVFSGLAWGLIAGQIKDEVDVFRYSVIFDAVASSAYFIVPVVFMGVRPSPTCVIGALLVVVGVVLAKNG